MNNGHLQQARDAYGAWLARWVEVLMLANALGALTGFVAHAIVHSGASESFALIAGLVAGFSAQLLVIVNFAPHSDR